MICKEAESLTNGCVDGELDLAGNLEIEQHIQGCSLWAQGYIKHQVLRNAIKAGSLYFKAPADLQRRIQLSLRRAEKDEAGHRMLPKWWFNIAAPMAAAAGVLLAPPPVLPRTSGDGPLGGVVRSN